MLCDFLGVGLLSMSATSLSASAFMNQESHFNFKQAGFFTLAFTDFLLPTLTHVFTGKEKSMPKQSGRDRLGWHSG